MNLSLGSTIQVPKLSHTLIRGAGDLGDRVYSFSLISPWR